MLVRKRMSSPVITVAPDLPIMQALDLMKKNRIRRLPVMKNGKMVGIVSEGDLLNASPSDVTSLSVWELNYLLGKITVDEIMSKNVITVNENTPIEEAAYLMDENKIGGLPVVADNGELVGLITETDLFRIFLELMSARQPGVRVTALVPDKPGELEAVSHVITKAGGDFLSMGTFAGESSANRILTFKVRNLEEDTVRELIAPHIEELVDIRTCCP